MAYATGPYSSLSALPALPRPVLYSSRAIDPESERYLIDSTTGGNESMGSVAQRVLLLCSTVARTALIDPTSLAETEAALRTALAPLTSGPAPAIDLQSVTVEHEYAGHTKRVVRYRDLQTQQDEQVQT